MKPTGRANACVFRLSGCVVPGLGRGEQKQVNFMLDAKQGDTICLGADGQGCGTVVQDHKARRDGGRRCGIRTSSVAARVSKTKSCRFLRLLLLLSPARATLWCVARQYDGRCLVFACRRERQALEGKRPRAASYLDVLVTYVTQCFAGTNADEATAPLAGSACAA